MASMSSVPPATAASIDLTLYRIAITGGYGDEARREPGGGEQSEKSGHGKPPGVRLGMVKAL
jgi:hypothetical protein